MPPKKIGKKSGQCLDLNCNKSASYGFITDKKRLYCKDHHVPGTINVSHKLCEYPSCDIRAHFNLKGMKAKFCEDHSEKDMVNVVNKLCIIDGCDNQRCYALPGEPQRYCTTHAP